MCFFKRKKKENKSDIKLEDSVEKQEIEQNKTVAKKEEKKAEIKNTETKKDSKKQKTSKKEEVKEESKQNSSNEEKAERKSVYRVIYNKESKVWNIKKDGAKRIIDSKTTKEEALKRVKELSENKDTGFVVYKKDGKFQKK